MKNSLLKFDPKYYPIYMKIAQKFEDDYIKRVSTKSSSAIGETRILEEPKAEPSRELSLTAA